MTLRTNWAVTQTFLLQNRYKLQMQQIHKTVGFHLFKSDMAQKEKSMAIFAKGIVVYYTSMQMHVFAPATTFSLFVCHFKER